MAGTTNARTAQPGTIRGDFAMSGWNNVIHASENSEIAKEEIVRFFDENELFDYQRVDFETVYADDER
jgi:nucleoside-diphosphate kinase